MLGRSLKNLSRALKMSFLVSLVTLCAHFSLGRCRVVVTTNATGNTNNNNNHTDHVRQVWPAHSIPQGHYDGTSLHSPTTHHARAQLACSLKVVLQAVGKPVVTKQMTEADDPEAFAAEVDRVHAEFMKRLAEVYDKYRGMYGWEDMPLRIE